MLAAYLNVLARLSYVKHGTDVHVMSKVFFYVDISLYSLFFSNLYIVLVQEDMKLFNMGKTSGIQSSKEGKHPALLGKNKKKKN